MDYSQIVEAMGVGLSVWLITWGFNKAWFQFKGFFS